MTSKTRRGPLVVHLTTTDMSLDWLLAPQLSAFSAAGYDIVGMSAPGDHVEGLEARGIRHIAVPAFTRSSSITQDLRAFLQLLRHLRRLRPDIVHTHNPKPGVLGRVAARITGVPLVINTQHGIYALPDDRRRRRWPVYVVERCAAAFSDIELVQNPEDVATLVDHLHIPAERVRLLGNGIDLEHFQPTLDAEESGRALRRAWGVADDEILIGAVARLVADKGIRELFAVSALLKEADVPARLVIVGPDEPGKTDAISDAEVALARDEGVIFAGRHDDMPGVYTAFDIFLSASWREGIPRAAMEAAAMGLATIATDVRGNRQVVDHGTTGVLVPARSPRDIAAACSWLVADSDERERMGWRASLKARREFDQDDVIRATLAAYAEGASVPLAALQDETAVAYR